MTDLQPEHLVSIPSKLGFDAEYTDGVFKLLLTPNPTTMIHGAIRASVAAYVVDAVAGIVVDDDLEYWSLTSDLSVRMEAVAAPELIVGTTEVLRRGRRSSTSKVELVDGNGTFVGSGAAAFTRVPRREGDPPKPNVSPEATPALFKNLGLLDRPLRDEVGVEAVDPANGVVRVKLRPELCNSAGTLQGAMVALIAEAAAEDLVGERTEEPFVLIDMDIRYLSQANAGFVVTRSRAIGDGPNASIEVEILDEATDKVLTHVYARAAAAPQARA
jgi:acyl-coenzyme A thioesterase PaaI-like protein